MRVNDSPASLKINQLNKRLQDQLNSHFASGYQEVPAHLAELFKSISKVYDEYESGQQRTCRENHVCLFQQITGVGSWELALDSQCELGKELVWSQEVFEIFGFGINEVPVSTELFFAHLLPVDRRRVEEALQNTLKTGKEFVADYWVVRHDGTERFVHQRGELVNDPATGKPAKIVGVIQDITNRKKAEEELKTKESHLRMSQHIARLGSWEADLPISASTVPPPMRLSDETYRLLGYEPGEVSAEQNIFDKHIHPDDKEKMYGAISAAIKNAGTFEVEHRLVTRQGKLLHVVGRGEVTINKLRNKPVKVVGVLQDISEQKKAAANLEQAKANFRNILENTDTAFVLLDVETNILLFNRQADELMRRETGNKMTIGARYSDLVRFERKEIVQQALATVAQKRQKLTYESHYVEDDRPDTWYYVSIHPVFNDAAELIGISVATREITREKSTLDQVRLSNERYELVTRATKDVIWDWDLMDDKLYRSSTYAEVFGEATVPDDRMKDGWIERVHEEDQARVYQHMMSCIEDARVKVWEDQYRFFRLNGELAYVKDRGLIIRNNNGQAIRMVGAMRDVTPQTMLEKERDKMTADLLQRNAALEQFTYIVSHNLRAPVANILGLSELLKNSQLDEESFAMCLTGLESTTLKLDQVIKDLDQVLQARQQSDHNKEKIDLGQLVEEIQEMIGHEQGRHDIWINMAFASPAEVYCLRSYLHSIFHNLITNSIKYRKSTGPLKIDISSVVTEEYTVIRFKDNGTGMDLKAYGDKVFGMYKRFHSAVEGKGVGLFMTKTQVEALGGKIALQSAPGEGAEFTVEIPHP